jgi:serine/threonine protein kinase
LSFEQGLTPHEKLEEAAREDRNHLEHKVRVEIEKRKSDHGLRRERHGVHYLLLLQVQALLTGKDEHSIPQLNKFQYHGRNARVGEGGSGEVSRVTWCEYDCVLKEYDALKLEDSEVNSLKKCNHPHIVRFFRSWKDKSTDKSRILMESMERDLDKHIESQMSKTKPVPPFSEPVAIDIMLQVINAIWHMHSKGIVHRDLKPKNVLVRSGSVLSSVLSNELLAKGYVQVKLGDFGIVKEDMMTSYAGALTYKAGTTLYRAPELASIEYTRSGTRKFPRKIDLWSFGIMCSQILTGQQPFEEIEVYRLQGHVEKGGRPSIDDCPDYLRFCMESCWEKRPENRPRSLDMWRMLRVAQLRSLGLLERKYDHDLFTFKDHNNKLVSLTPRTVRPST